MRAITQPIRLTRLQERHTPAVSTSQDRLRAISEQLNGADRRTLSEFDAVRFGWWMAVSRSDLWAAAFVLMGGCSDDSFMDFRSWLILQGRDAIEAIVRDPDSLADYPFVESPSAQGLSSVARKLCSEKLEKLEFDPDVSAWPPDCCDGDWSEESAEQLFPKIAANPLWKRR